MQTPVSGLQFLQNFRDALAEDIFFDEKIFTDDEVLKRMFAGSRIWKSTDVPAPRMGIYLTSYPNQVDSLASDPSVPVDRHMGLSVDKIDTKVVVTLSNASGLHLSRSDLENVFGTDWHIAPNPRHPALRSPNAKLPKYRPIESALSNVSADIKQGTAGFDDSGLLTHMNVILEGPKL